jgi:o-succinylbenzoate synthase
MDYELKFQFKLYQHNFKQPFQTHHGVWDLREGIIVSLTNPEGITTRGEIAPLPWFGSETIAQAVAFCQQLGNVITEKVILNIPDHLPCCQFALESALLALNLEPTSDNYPQGFDFCYLLPAGVKALTTWQALYQAHDASTFKWKIGVLSLAEEIEILKQLTTDLPAQVKLRLDANGGLNLAQARKLLSVTDRLQGIEFIEQPLPPGNFANMLQLSQEHTTLLALDESVASFSQLEQAYKQGWGGIYVIKAAIMGYPSRLRQFCQNHALDVVFSSSLETEIGREAVLKLILQLDHPRAIGFGVQHLY